MITKVKNKFFKTHHKFFINKINGMQLYKLQKLGYKDSYILIHDNLYKNNTFKISNKIFEIFENCEGICFEFQTGVNYTQEINKEFNSLINRSIYIIELIYTLLIKSNKSPNFVFFLSYINQKLNHYSKLLTHFNKIFKIKKRLGKNLNYLMISNKKVGFGMLDPEGCLILENNRFNFKPISLKPIVYTNEIFDKYEDLFKEKNVDSSLASYDNSKKKILKAVSITIINKWITKIKDNEGFLFVIPSIYLLDSKEFNNFIEKSDYEVIKIN